MEFDLETSRLYIETKGKDQACVVLRPRKIIQSTLGVIFSEAYDFAEFLAAL